MLYAEWSDGIVSCCYWWWGLFPTWPACNWDILASLLFTLYGNELQFPSQLMLYSHKIALFCTAIQHISNETWRTEGEKLITLLGAFRCRQSFFLFCDLFCSIDLIINPLIVQHHCFLLCFYSNLTDGNSKQLCNADYSTETGSDL